MTTMWQPASEDDIVEGIKNGAIAESHFMEVKEQARNEQIAQTLASFALDGGIFIVGIAEEKDGNGNKRLVPKPVPVAGMMERVDSISRNSIDPPLPVATRIIRSGDQDKGFVVVHIPASPLAPHMTGNKYYARADSSKYALSDSEVLRHHDRRREQSDLGARLLDEAESNDYLPLAERQYGHIYLVAEPLMPANQRRIEEFLSDVQNVVALVQAGQDSCRTNLASFGPSPMYATRARQRATGVSVITNDADGKGRTPNSDGYSEASLLDIEFTYSGGLRIFVGRATYVTHGGERVVNDGLVVAYAQRLAYWVKELCSQYGYGSLWTIGLRINGVEGLRSRSKVDDWSNFDTGGTLDSSSYSAVHTTSADAFDRTPEDVVASLAGRLLRVLGTTDEHLGNTG